MRTTILAGALVLVAGAALAGQCPLELGRVDAALKAGTDLGAYALAQVMALQDEGDSGEMLPKTGRHGQSVETLADANAILGID